MVIQFPDQKERRILRHQKVLLKRKKAVSKFQAWAKKVGLGISYYSRLVLANTIHCTAGCSLIFLHALQKPIFFLLALVGVVNWLTFGQLMPPEEYYLVPFFGVLSLLAVSGELITKMMDDSEPFHRLLRCKEFRSKENGSWSKGQQN